MATSASVRPDEEALLISCLQQLRLLCLCKSSSGQEVDTPYHDTSTLNRMRMNDNELATTRTWLSSMPEDILQSIMEEFDPLPTVDTNDWTGPYSRRDVRSLAAIRL
jgi:hypothetical protein